MTRWMTTLCLFVLLTAIGAHGSPPKVQTSAHGDYLVPVAGPQFSPSDDLLKQILEELRGLRKDVQTLRLNQSPGELTVAALAPKYCMKCHKIDVAETDGGNFVMFDEKGELVPFSVNESRKISKKVETNAMPPGKKLAEEEKRPFILLDPKKQEQQRK